MAWPYDTQSFRETLAGFRILDARMHLQKAKSAKQKRKRKAVLDQREAALLALKLSV